MFQDHNALLGCIAYTECKDPASCYRCSVVTLSVFRLLDRIVSPTKTVEPIEIVFWTVDSGGPGNHIIGAGRGSPPGELAILGVVPPLKCIRLCKQQTPQRHGTADLSTGNSASRPMRDFTMHSPDTGGGRSGDETA